jgi:hypothetical protein
MVQCRQYVCPKFWEKRGGEDLLCGTAKGFHGFGMRFMSVKEEIEMLEGAKDHLETQIKNIDTRLKKLKA